ncbi:double-strand-break repair protein rad21 homolog [Setaria italica]|uniref:double-strand-break repair protein rad21 homolog n=1 Tax=Setaria italica TaxID=4555 RepID=UPI00064782E1|nr:double-strand-break repair protein rad21 homolog [Setaria italica]
MFYSHTILAWKSPLGTVWIAAHLERKIKKPQIDGIDIPTYAESIMFPEVPIALRLSGHLLLGLVRIYSWKVNYLFQDCNRMITTIRTTFVAVEIDLPVEVEPAPFDSIRLPLTLNLDDLNLDDVISQRNTPANDQKTLDQITLAEREYVMIDLDEDDRIEPPACGLSPYMGPEPFEAGTFPRFDDGFGANNTLSDEIPLDPSPGNMLEKPNIETPSDGAQDPPEIMREAPQEEPDHLTDSVFGNDDLMVVDKYSSPFVQNKGISSVILVTKTGEHQLFTGVFYIPVLRNSIICLGQLDESSSCVEIDSGVERGCNRLYILYAAVAQPLCLAACRNDEAWWWHERFGHLQFEALKQLNTKEMVRGMPWVDHVEQLYNTCIMKRRASEPRSGSSSCTAIFLWDGDASYTWRSALLATTH